MCISHQAAYIGFQCTTNTISRVQQCRDDRPSFRKTASASMSFPTSPLSRTSTLITCITVLKLAVDYLKYSALFLL